MSNEIERMFASLSADADSTPVMEATTLRTKTNRRAAAQTGLAGFALVAVVAGTAFGGQWLLAGQGRPLAPPGSSASATPPAVTTPTAAPSTAPSGAPSTPPSSTASDEPSPNASSASPAPTVPKSVPLRAFLSKAELNDSSGFNEESGDEEALPSFCRADFASDDSIGVGSTLRAFYRRQGEEVTNVPDGVLLQAVTVYKAQGAQAFMNELREAVDDCVKETATEGKDDEYRTLGPIDVGDDSFRIEVRYQAPARLDSEDEMATFTQQISVVRAGDTVTILRTQGYENFSAPDAAVVAMTRAAYQNVTDWRK